MTYGECISTRRSAWGFDSTDPEEWRGRALCAQIDVGDLFFPNKGGSNREPKQICGMCEVTQECLQAALDNDERFGIWGGLSERERRRLKRAYAPPVIRDICGTPAGAGKHYRLNEPICSDCRAAVRDELRERRDQRELSLS